jgi:hypothetical protein
MTSFRSRLFVLLLGGIALFSLGFLSDAAYTQKELRQPEIVRESWHDVSPPLRDIKPLRRHSGPPEEHEIRLLHPPRGITQPADPVRQTSALASVATTNGANFDGVAANGSAPPDTSGAAGATQYVEWVNTEFAVYDKATHNLVLGPVAGNTLWSGFGGSCETNNDGDIIAIYDKLNSRWVMSQLSVSGGPPFYQCVAVSQTSDATGKFNRYQFQQPGFNDYPKLGVWPDAYYATYNMFDNAGLFFQGARLCAMDSAAMRAGNTATQQCFQLSTSFGGVLPSDLDGATPPPAGEPAFFLNFNSSTLNSLNLWKFHVDFANSGNTTLTGPTALSVASFAEACGGGTCIAQSGTTQKLDTLADRLMYRLAYRNFGDHESLGVNHSVTAGTVAGIRWYEIQNPGTNPAIFQQGTFAPDSNHRWMGSIAMDKSGDIAVGYSVSSSTLHPAIRYTGRVPSDPLGMMESETSIIEGPGSQTGGLSRWGDYSSMSVDPSDDCTFWYATEYQPANGSFNWHTRIASFKFSGCGGPPTPDFSVSASPSSQTVVQGSGTSYSVSVAALNGFSGTVTLNASGLPAGAGASFSPSNSVNTSGSVTMNVTTSTTTTPGTYTITVQGTSGSTSHSATVQLVINSLNPPNFSISASPSSQTVTRPNSTSYTVTVTAVNGFSGSVSFSVSGLPSRSTASFNPTSVTGSGTSTLTISTRSRTTTGTRTLTITGTSGSLTHSTTVSLTVK